MLPFFSAGNTRHRRFPFIVLAILNFEEGTSKGNADFLTLSFAFF